LSDLRKSPIFIAVKSTFMKTKDLGLRIAGTIFAVVALAHLLRLFTSASVLIATWALPLWMSAVGFVVTGFLCFWLWKISFGKHDL
jgi:hypothetical protein